MFFLHLYCKKGNFLSFTSGFFLSYFGMLLKSALGARSNLINQPHANDIKANTLHQENKRDQFNVTMDANKKFVTLHTKHVLPVNAFQSILTLNTFLIITVVTCTQLRHLQMQYFSNKRAPPICELYYSILFLPLTLITIRLPISGIHHAYT